MFEKGTFILYGTVGVCLVDKISEADFSKDKRLYYYLVPRFEKDMTIYTPVDNDKVSMRRIMTRQEAQDFVMGWPKVECKQYANDRERATAYKQIFQSGSCLELASMIKEISETEQSRRVKGKLLSIREKDGVKTARKLLFGELATALDIPPEEVNDYIVASRCDDTL